MSFNRKSNQHYLYHRKPGGQKYRKDSQVRPGARPANTWDDLPLGRENYGPLRHCKRMLSRFSQEEIVKKLVLKWSLTEKQATEMYLSVTSGVE